MVLRLTGPDDGADPSQLASSAYSADVLEALTRIGSIGSWTRAGRVLYATSFEAGIGGWSRTPLVGSVSVDRSRPFHGAQCLKITPQTASPFECLTAKRFPLVFHKRYGIEALISMDALATGWELFAGFLSQQFGTVPQFAVKYDKGTDALYHLNSSGAWTQFATGVADLRSTDEPPLWVLAKLIVSADPTGFGYHAFILNDRVYDMRSLSFLNSASASSNPRLTVQLWAFDTSGGAHPVYFDCFILTTDEPVYVS